MLKGCSRTTNFVGNHVFWKFLPKMFITLTSRQVSCSQELIIKITITLSAAIYLLNFLRQSDLGSHFEWWVFLSWENLAGIAEHCFRGCKSWTMSPTKIEAPRHSPFVKRSNPWASSTQISNDSFLPVLPELRLLNELTSVVVLLYNLNFSKKCGPWCYIGKT